MSDTEKTTNIKITDSAQGYLTELLAKQNTDGIGVRIFVEHPGTPRAECCMSYSQPDEHNPDDLKLDYETFTAYIDTPRTGIGCHHNHVVTTGIPSKPRFLNKVLLSTSQP